MGNLTDAALTFQRDIDGPNPRGRRATAPCPSIGLDLRVQVRYVLSVAKAPKKFETAYREHLSQAQRRHVLQTM